MHTTVIFFFNDTATTEIYTLSLHDALPISRARDPASVSERHHRPHQGEFSLSHRVSGLCQGGQPDHPRPERRRDHARSEEHTSELQSRLHLVCRLLLAKNSNSTLEDAFSVS